MGPGYHFQEEPGNKMAATKRVLNLGELACRQGRGLHRQGLTETV